jgi:hypothetical protein
MVPSARIGAYASAFNIVRLLLPISTKSVQTKFVHPIDEMRFQPQDEAMPLDNHHEPLMKT